MINEMEEIEAYNQIKQTEFYEFICRAAYYMMCNEDLSFEENNFYIVENGRQKGEKSILLFENGTFKGYGYVPFHVQYSPVDKWKKHITLIQEDKDARTIIITYLNLNTNLTLMPF